MKRLEAAACESETARPYPLGQGRAGGRNGRLPIIVVLVLALGAAAPAQSERDLSSPTHPVVSLLESRFASR